MGIFNDRSKRALVGAMRECVCDTLMESATLTSKQATDKMNFVFENATYEQLLNITMNPSRNTNYLPAYVLEGAVALLHRACLTKRKNIGPNAITEAAGLIQNETGATITESMMVAALNSVNNGNGLKVVEKLLEEAVLLQEANFENQQLTQLQRIIGSQPAANIHELIPAGIPAGPERNAIIADIRAHLRNLRSRRTPLDATSLTNEVNRIIGAHITPPTGGILPTVDAGKITEFISARNNRIDPRAFAEKILRGGSGFTAQEDAFLNAERNKALKAYVDKVRGLDSRVAPNQETFSNAMRSLNGTLYSNQARTLEDNITRLTRQGTLTSSERADLQKWTSQLNNLKRRYGINVGSPAGSRAGRAAAGAVNPGIFGNISREAGTRAKGMNPWAAAGLAAAGTLGGAWLWNRYKQNQQ